MRCAICFVVVSLVPNLLVGEVSPDAVTAVASQRRCEPAGRTSTDRDWIQPYEKNPRYWQCKGKPVLLLGGTDDDNLFQWTGSRLTRQLDLLKSTGGNYIRCTMSGRDEGNVQPFAQADGKYDLNQWNDEYWNRFAKMLELTRERDIIVQIEVWAFHDFNQRWWAKNPWHPANNISYDLSSTTLKESYGNIGKVPHDFFFTVPKLNNDGPVLAYQQKYVDKLLSYTLRFDHVLYCMTNEIHPQFSPEWGWYWSEHIKEEAAAADKKAETTEMYWEIDLKKPQQRASLDRPDVFSFFEASQNSAQRGQKNGDNLRFAYDYLARKPRPINHVKIYGADTGTWKGSTDRHATECFWRNIMGGSASSRFHRPPYGLGLGKKAQTHIWNGRDRPPANTTPRCSAASWMFSATKASRTSRLSGTPLASRPTTIGWTTIRAMNMSTGGASIYSHGGRFKGVAVSSKKRRSTVNQ